MPDRSTFQVFSTLEQPGCNPEVDAHPILASAVNSFGNSLDRDGRKMPFSAFPPHKITQLRRCGLAQTDRRAPAEKRFRQQAVIVGRQHPDHPVHVKLHLKVRAIPAFGGHGFEQGQESLSQTKCMALGERSFPSLFHFINDKNRVCYARLQNGFQHAPRVCIAPAALRSGQGP